MKSKAGRKENGLYNFEKWFKRVKNNVVIESKEMYSADESFMGFTQEYFYSDIEKQLREAFLLGLKIKNK
jgi:hypothetical protein